MYIHINLKSNTYIGFSIENRDEDPKFEFDEHLRIS